MNQHDLPCLLLDDGSNPATKQALAQALANTPGTHAAPNTLIRYEINRGKGAVVCDGILYAAQHGYTHALQVDADGQHDLGDIPTFLKLSQLNPNDIISGCRSYTAMPTKRRYGRIVTDIWVCINTLSYDIRDSMCGYRLYPVTQTAALLHETTVGARMDFDTDIIVRLYWNGLSVQHVETSVIYDDHIVSHFDLWNDNLRISKMHARLLFGMLLRLPKLLLRKITTRRPSSGLVTPRQSDAASVIEKP